MTAATHAAEMQTAEPLVRVTGLKKYFPVTRGILIQHTVGQVRRLTASASILTGGRRWGWSESRAVAKRPQAAPFWGCMKQPPGRLRSAGCPFTASGAGTCWRCVAGRRSFSRTPSPR
jgi:hypothetical protein